jgi:hypothetical protein
MLLGEIVVVLAAALGAAALAAWTAPRWLRAGRQAWHELQAQLTRADHAWHSNEEDNDNGR